VLASRSARADLVIIGRHGVAGELSASTIQHAVLGHAHGPVAIVPSALLAVHVLRLDGGLTHAVSMIVTNKCLP